MLQLFYITTLSRYSQPETAR